MSFPNRGEIQSNHLKYMKTRPSMRAQLLATLIVVTASFDRVAAQTPPVIVSAWPTNQVIFPGATNVSFYAVAVGTAPLQYDWFFNGVKLENKTNAVQILRQRHQFHVATEPRSVKKANSYQLGKDGVWEYWSDGVVGPPSPQYSVTSLL